MPARQGFVLRHGRDDRQDLPNRRTEAADQSRLRGRAHLPLQEGERAAAAHPGYRDGRDRRRRRLGRARRPAEADRRRTEQRGGGSGAGLLWTGRHGADGDRCRSLAWPHRSDRFFRRAHGARSSRRGGGDAAGGGRALGAGGRARRARGQRDRRREHGERGAPLHAARLAEKLGLDRALVPSYAGVGSAVGFLRAPIAYEIVRSALQRLDQFDPAAANALLAAMRAEAEPIIRRGAGDAPLTETRSAFMRYRGQGHEIAVPLPTRTYHDDDTAILRAIFEEAYCRFYNRSIPEVEFEILSWVLLLSAPSPSETAAAPPPSEPHTPQPARLRPVFDPET